MRDVVRISGCHELDQDPILLTDSRRQLNLVKQNDIIPEESAGAEDGGALGEIKEGKKAFVEPAISVPVDVLEATTFFQAATSGGTK
jgi:hypothetical protein